MCLVTETDDIVEVLIAQAFDRLGYQPLGLKAKVLQGGQRAGIDFGRLGSGTEDLKAITGKLAQ